MAAPGDLLDVGSSCSSKSRLWWSLLLALSMGIYFIILERDLGSLMSSSHADFTTSHLLTTSTSTQCPAQEKGYRSVFCPHWPLEELNPDKRAYVPKEDLPREVDPYIRYLYGKQNPPDCSTANYYFREHFLVGLGASLYASTAAGFISAAVPFDRVFLVTPGTFPYGTCEGEEKGWDCYFEPLSRCNYSDTDAIIAKYPGLPAKDQGASPGHFRDDNIRVAQGEGYLQSFSYDTDGKLNRWKGLFDMTREEMYAYGVAYMLRLNNNTKTIIEGHLRDSIPCDFDPTRSISLPIRASDKCSDQPAGESECPSFEFYMGAAEEIRKMDPFVDTIVLTSEDPNVMAIDRSQYEEQGWRFVLNEGDSARNTGSVHHHINHQDEVPLDAIFVSSLSTLHFIMRSKYLLLNCSSNFHVLAKFLMEFAGCTLVPRSVFVCLNQQSGPFRICAWGDFHNHPPCIEKRLKMEAAEAARKAAEEEVEKTRRIRRLSSHASGVAEWRW